jgi:hypothetical protein
MGGRGGGSSNRRGNSETSTPVAESSGVPDILRKAFEANRVHGTFGEFGTRAQGEYVFVSDLRDALAREGITSREAQDNFFKDQIAKKNMRVIGEDAQWTVTQKAIDNGLKLPGIRQNFELATIKGFGVLA